jgi:hypothetical protein
VNPGCLDLLPESARPVVLGSSAHLEVDRCCRRSSD